MNEGNVLINEVRKVRKSSDFMRHLSPDVGVFMNMCVGNEGTFRAWHLPFFF